MAMITKQNLSGHTVEYGGIRFDGVGSQQIVPPQIQCSQRARYDAAGVAVVAIDVSLAVRAVVFADSEAQLSTMLAALRETLLTPRLPLSLLGTGVGFSVDPTDITHGPSPQSCDTTPLGPLAAAINWAVQFSVAPTDSTISSETMTECSWATVWDIDEGGKTTRTITGTLSIPQQWQRGQTFVTADDAREGLIHIVPSGFALASQRFELADDKRSLHFQFVVRQLRDIPPDGFVSYKRHITLTMTGVAGMTGQIQLRAEALPAAGTPQRAGLAVFTAWIQHLRWRISQHTAPHTVSTRTWLGFAAHASHIAPFSANTGALAAYVASYLVPIPDSAKYTTTTTQEQATVLLQRLSTEYDASSGVTTYSVTLKLAGKTISELLTEGDVWEPLAGTDRDSWAASLRRIRNVRGDARLVHDATADVVVDPSTRTGTVVLGRSPAMPLHPDSSGNGFSPDPAVTGVYPGTSYLTARVWITYRRYDQLSFTTASSDRSQYTPGGDYRGPGGSVVDNAGVVIPGPAYSGTSDQLSVEAIDDPDIVVLQHFELLRILYAPGEIPYLQRDKDGRKLVYLGAEQEEDRHVGDIGGMPVRRTVGVRYYRAVPPTTSNNN